MPFAAIRMPVTRRVSPDQWSSLSTPRPDPRKMTMAGTWPRARLWAALAVAALVTPVALWASGAAALASALLVLLALIMWEGHRARGT